MLKCPFCNFQNEDGALFCEQCKSDLGLVSAPAAAVPPIPMAHVMPEPMPVAAVVEEPPMATFEPAPFAPVAAVAVAAPVEAMPMPAIPEPPPPPAVVPVPVPVAEVAPPVVAAVVAPPPPAPPPPAPPGPAPAPAAAPAAEGSKLAADAKPRLVVVRGQKINVEFPVYEGLNFIGRADDKPVDIDLEDQEPQDRIWCSRQHALINLEEGMLTIEDLNSANGTYVNRARIYPGQKKQLNVNDVVQIGTVQMKVKA